MRAPCKQVKAAAKAFRVFWSKADEDEEDEDQYEVEHSVVWYLMGPDGEFKEFFLQSDSPSKMTEGILAHLRNPIEVVA